MHKVNVIGAQDGDHKKHITYLDRKPTKNWKDDAAIMISYRKREVHVFLRYDNYRS